MSQTIQVTVPITLDLLQQDRDVIKQDAAIDHIVRCSIFDYIEYKKDMQLKEEIENDPSTISLLDSLWEALWTITT